MASLTAGTLGGVLHVGTPGGQSNPTYLLSLAPTALTLANAHQFSIGGAGVATEQGRLVAGGYTVSDAPYFAMPHKVAGTNAIRSADAWSALWGAPVRACTIYLDFLGLGAHLKSNQVLFALTDDSGTNPSLKIVGNGTGYRVIHHNGTTSVLSDATALAAGTMFQRVRLRARLNADGSVQIHQRLGTAAEESALVSTALTPAAAWGMGGLATSKCYIGPGPMLLLGAVVVWRDTTAAKLDTYL